MLTPPAHIESGPWMLDPEIAYLNHGSFGARTKQVFEHQMKLKQEFEQSPIQFLDRARGEMIGEARAVVSSFLGCDSEGLGFVDNATTGVGCAIHSIEFNHSDEILTTNHVYNGVRQLLLHHANRVGCKYRELDIHLPIQDSDELLSSIVSSFNVSTKLLVVDHVASSTAIVFPVAQIIEECRKRGILVLIDGAHGPGMLDLSIDSLNPDWYVGNLHKWVCAPVGAGFIWTSKPRSSGTHPLTVSHYLGTKYTEEFDWQGTKDITPWLAAVTAIREGGNIGWPQIRKHNHEMAMWMHQELIESLGQDPIVPLDGSLIGSMATVPLVGDFPNTYESCDQFRDELFAESQIEVPIMFFNNACFVRVSAQLYSKIDDIHRLISVLKKTGIKT